MDSSAGQAWCSANGFQEERPPPRGKRDERGRDQGDFHSTARSPPSGNEMLSFLILSSHICCLIWSSQEPQEVNRWVLQPLLGGKMLREPG